MSLRFTKMHGAGNDFVVLDRRGWVSALPRALIQRLANRRTGIGCDQVMCIEDSPRTDCAYAYAIYNSDGSPAGQCGNGLRCIARWLWDRELLPGDGARLLGPAGVVEVERLGDGQIRADMGEPDFRPDSIPTRLVEDAQIIEVTGRPVRLGAVSMGNPHALIEVDEVSSAAVEAIGAALQDHPAFPDRVNVGFAERRASDLIRLRVYERGVGETLACGSGACAAVAILRQRGRVDRRVRVELPGGELLIEWPGPGHSLWMTGPAATVFEGEWIHD